MGTSASSKGSNSSSPLIPAWAAPDGVAVPAPDGQRFRAFRTELGRAAAGGGQPALKKALGHYSRSALGGASTGAIRFGPVTSVGGALLGALAGASSATPTGFGLVLATMAGRPVRDVIDSIVGALAPENADGDRIRAALEEALSTGLEGVTDFDPQAITEDLVASILIEYLAQAIFLHVMAESGSAFDRAGDPAKSIEIQNALLELVRATVEVHATSLFEDGSTLNETVAATVQAEVVAQVLRDWEANQ